MYKRQDIALCHVQSRNKDGEEVHWSVNDNGIQIGDVQTVVDVVHIHGLSVEGPRVGSRDGDGSVENGKCLKC